MNLEEKLLTRLQKIASERKLSDLADKSGVSQSNISRALGKDRQNLGLDKVSKILEALDAEVIFADERENDPGRDICFVDAKVVPAGEHQRPPQVEDYLAVPVVEEVGAGPGIVPQGDLRSWFLVYKHQDAVRYRRNLIAVEIGRGSTSMLPTLSPRDIVLVDRDDRDVRQPGHIMLVMEPDGSGMIKRVSVEEISAQRDFRLIFYSDNVAENPPLIFSLRDDFLGEWERAIVGRVVWAWSDIREK